jgi:hypothetical protein
MYINPDPKLTEREAAEYLNVSMYWLQKDRCYGLGGPAAEYIGTAVRYRLSALDAYVAANSRRKAEQLHLPLKGGVAR